MEKTIKQLAWLACTVLRRVGGMDHTEKPPKLNEMSSLVVISCREI